MCTPAQCKPVSGSFLDHLSRLSSAEEFFAALGLEFDQKVVSVSRLHILKRFHDLLDTASIGGLDDESQKLACRHALERAYSEFATGGGAKTFKVFETGKTGFVPLAAISRSK